MFPIHRRLLASIVAAPALAAVAHGPTDLGPTPYLSRADSPLLLTRPALDDLEDDALDLLGVSGVNGSPFFIPVFQSTFDGSGELALTTTVPSGLAGVTLDMVGLGVAPSGKVKFSDEVELMFN